MHRKLVRALFALAVSSPAGGAQGAGLEYHVKVDVPSGETLYFPATAPALNQTLVVVPRPERRY